MGVERIVSFFPSATELLYELGVGDKIFGVTHECLYPENAKSKPRVINSVFNPNTMSSREIDDKIVELMRDGKEIYKIDEENLRQARPDLIISQDTCEVCSAYTSHVTKALEILDKKPEIYPLNPHDVKGILDSIDNVAKKIGMEEKGREIIQSDPDIIVLMPCGFDVERTVSEYKKILQNDRDWNKIRAVRQQNVFAVDANSYFSKPSLRTVTGIEILAKIIHPEIFEKIKNPEVSFKQIKS